MSADPQGEGEDYQDEGRHQDSGPRPLTGKADGPGGTRPGGQGRQEQTHIQCGGSGFAHSVMRMPAPRTP